MVWYFYGMFVVMALIIIDMFLITKTEKLKEVYTPEVVKGLMILVALSWIGVAMLMFMHVYNIFNWIVNKFGD